MLPLSTAAITSKAPPKPSSKISSPPSQADDYGLTAICGEIDTVKMRHESGNAFIVSYFAVDGDTLEQPAGSSVVILENGVPLGPAHTLHQAIRDNGLGRFSHWYTWLLFSTSDNSDPRTNGRKYSYGVISGSCPVPICGGVNTSQAVHIDGENYYIAKAFGFQGDKNEAPAQSGLRLFEDHKEIGPAHSNYVDIVAYGGGRFSHWGNALYFSTSDGSNPITNGKSYVYGGTCRKLETVRFTKVADNSPNYSTFQSHNQKLVSTGSDLFFTYLDKGFPSEVPPEWGEEYLWKLMRSTDNGKSFTTVYQHQLMAKAPAIEVTENGDLFLFESDVSPAGYSPTSGKLIIYKFLKSQNYTNPQIKYVDGAAAPKYTSWYDSIRKQIYFFSYHNYQPNFLVFDLNGDLLFSKAIVTEGVNAYLQYPHLTMVGSTLFAGWTSLKKNEYIYWDIHFMKSEDGGASWQRLDDFPLVTPVPADDSTQAANLVFSDEFGHHNWLSSMFAKGNLLHFMYLANITPLRQHYASYTFGGGQTQIWQNRYPVWSGEHLAIQNIDGFFTSTDSTPGSMMYAVSTYTGSDYPDGVIVVLASDDNGQTWFDYAISRNPKMAYIYAISGPRYLSTDGHGYGMFTNILNTQESSSLGGNQTWFFEFPTE